MRNRIIIILILLLIATYAFGLLDFSKSEAYTTFKERVSNNEVVSVTFKEDVIEYKLAGDRSTYKSTNPQSATLREELLLNSIIVNDERDFNSLFDAIFNLIFISLIIFGLYKVATYYTQTFKVVKNTNVDFSNIAGLDELKKELLYRVSMLKNPIDNTRATKGIILEGEPGNGKTLFARALANECKVNFIATKGADFQGALMGLGAFKVKMLFNKARRKKPCIIFIDEFDSIGEKRNYAGSGIDKENNRVITTLLNEMDGFTPQAGILVIGATNSYHSLDSALIRPGRFDLKYRISAPDESVRKELIKLYLKNRSLDQSLSIDYLAKAFKGLSSAAIEAILNEAGIIQSQENKAVIDLNMIKSAITKIREKAQ